MSFVPTGKWADVGNGILLRTDQKKYIAAKDLLASLREYDMMEIKLLHPENHQVAVDTGVKPRIIKQANRHSVVLLAQISILQRFPKMLQMRCNCFDEINNDYYTMSIGISHEAPHGASLRICASLQPIENFGAPPPDMEAAFAAFAAKMRAKDKTPPK